jgi:hypothetical protein
MFSANSQYRVPSVVEHQQTRTSGSEVRAKGFSQKYFQGYKIQRLTELVVEGTLQRLIVTCGTTSTSTFNEDLSGGCIEAPASRIEYELCYRTTHAELGYVGAQ